MKLSELIKYKNELNKLSIATTRRQVDLDLSKFINLVDTQTFELGNYKEIIRNQYQTVDHELLVFDQHVQQLVQEIQTQIDIAEKAWFVESYRLYEEEMCNEPTDYILQRRPRLDSDVETLLRARIKNYTNWKYPGLIIRPGLENFVEDMVSCDPLYLVDQDYDLLVPARDRFTEEYQRRLRLHTVKESLDNEILGKIPNNQFGMCLVYNFFDFRPLEIFRKYLNEIYQKLRPGGTLIFTFNDCDRGKAVKLVEQHYACYTPGGLIKELCCNIGYEIVYSWNNGGPSNWLEIKKPGTLTSLKGGQTLAKIVPKQLRNLNSSSTI